MGKNQISKILTYDERFACWSKGKCPYCGSNKVTVKKTKMGGKHYICPNRKCRAENHFSRRKK